MFVLLGEIWCYTGLCFFVKATHPDAGYNIAVLSWPRAFHEVTQFFMHGAYDTVNSNLDFRQSFNVGVLNLVGVSNRLGYQFLPQVYCAGVLSWIMERSKTSAESCVT